MFPHHSGCIYFQKKKRNKKININITGGVIKKNRRKNKYENIKVEREM